MKETKTLLQLREITKRRAKRTWRYVRDGGTKASKATFGPAVTTQRGCIVAMSQPNRDVSEPRPRESEPR
jgi:hypothetical protein